MNNKWRGYNVSVCGADCGECSRRIKLKGLDPDAYYYREDKPELKLSGAALMNAGINVGGLWGDYASTLIHFI